VNLLEIRFSKRDWERVHGGVDRRRGNRKGDKCGEGSSSSVEGARNREGGKADETGGKVQHRNLKNERTGGTSFMTRWGHKSGGGGRERKQVYLGGKAITRHGGNVGESRGPITGM